MPKLVLRNVAVQSFFRIVSAATIKKIICGVEWDILIVIFKRLAGIPNVVLHVPPMARDTASVVATQRVPGNMYCIAKVLHTTKEKGATVAVSTATVAVSTATVAVSTATEAVSTATDRKSTRLNSSHSAKSRMPSSA